MRLFYWLNDSNSGKQECCKLHMCHPYKHADTKCDRLTYKQTDKNGEMIQDYVSACYPVKHFCVK